MCLRTVSSLFSPNLVDQSSCRIPTKHAKARPILQADWSIRLGENRPPDRALKHPISIDKWVVSEKTWDAVTGWV